MAAVPRANAPAIFELKSALLTLVAVVLKTTDVGAFARELAQRTADNPGLFDQDPVVIDLSPVRDQTDPIDFVALTALLRQHKMQPIAVKAGSAVQMAAALAAGLTEAPESAPQRPRSAGVPVPAEAPPAAVPSSAVTLIIDKPLRSGQQIYARGGDLVVLAVVSFGAEVIADGNIHVYAPLRGRAIAGARGNTQARIFATCMEPQLVSIAGIYRTTETPLQADVLGKVAQVWLDGEKLVVEALKP